MASRISYKNGKAEFSYTGADPWWGIAEKVSQHQTVAEAFARTLPWTVSTRPVRYQSVENGAFDMDSPNVRIIVRDDNHGQLGYATKSYKPIQNAQNAEIVETLVAEGAACVETIGALDGGSTCFVLVALSETGFEVKPGDAVKTYFLLRWGHDGRTTVAGRLVNKRVVCANTLNAAESECEAAFSLKHHNTATLRIDEARKALGIAHRAVQVTQAQYGALAGHRLTAENAVDYFSGVFPLDTETANAAGFSLTPEQEKKLVAWNAVQARLIDLYNGEGKGSELAGPTAWGAYNAVTEYLDHVYVVKADGKVSADRQESVLFGSYARTRANAYDAAVALIN